MREFLISKLNQAGAKVSVDVTGNLYAVKGEAENYPCIVAHMDQVSCHTHSGDFRVVRSTTKEGKAIFYGYSPSRKAYEGLGADDKNGIWVALKCMQEFDVLKAAFFVGEEVGCIGSKRADVDFFMNCRFVLQCDRRNDGDLITAISDEMCSQKFLDDVKCDLYGYTPTTGAMTDVDTLRESVPISMVNMSCGYYNPHTDKEFTVIENLEKCLDFVRHIIRDCTEVYGFPVSERGWRDYGGYYRDYDWFSSSWYDIISDKDAEIAILGAAKTGKELSFEDFTDIFESVYDTISGDPFELRDIYEAAIERCLIFYHTCLFTKCLYVDYWTEKLCDTPFRFEGTDIRCYPLDGILTFSTDGEVFAKMSFIEAVYILSTEGVEGIKKLREAV